MNKLPASSLTKKKTYLSILPLLLFILVTLSGCSVIKQPDPLAILVLRTPVPNVTLCEVAMPEQVVVNIPTTGYGLSTDRIVLLFDQREIKYLAGTRWDSRVPAMLQRQLIRYIEATSCFIGVGAEGSGIFSQYKLQGDLQRLHLCYEDDDPIPTAEIILRLSLIDTDRGKVLDSKTINFSEKAAGKDIPELMDALDNVMYRAMLDAARWTSSTVRTHSTPPQE